MPLLRQLFRIQTVSTPGVSAATYVPWVMVSRGLAFLRTLIVARILGKAGEAAFGLYQPALELINPIVALVMFGAADVAERYLARITRDLGTAGVRRFLLRQWLRIGITGTLVAAAMIALAPWIAPAIWGSPQLHLLALCAAAILALGFYQHLAATLRGLRAYGAAAGMEVTSALLLLAASIAAAFLNNADALIAAYLLSVLLPLLFYAALLTTHLQKNSSPAPTLKPNPTTDARRLTSFALWTMLRLLLVLTFSFLSLWGLKALETPLAAYDPAHTAQFSMPYRIAQLLAFVAVTAWASSYGIAARAWSHGQIRRAKAQYFRIGRLALMGLTLLAIALLLTRSLFGIFLHDYAQSITDLLPRMLALFIGYALLTFLSGYADLCETPRTGALLWALAVAIQIAALILGTQKAADFFPAQAPMPAAAHWILTASALGLAAGLLLGFRLLGRPYLSQAGLPLALLGLAAASLFAPRHVDLIAAATMSAIVLLLFLSASLIRPYDLRAFRRWRRRS